MLNIHSISPGNTWTPMWERYGKETGQLEVLKEAGANQQVWYSFFRYQSIFKKHACKEHLKKLGQQIDLIN